MTRFHMKLLDLGTVACICLWLLTGCATPATPNQRLFSAIDKGDLEQVQHSINSGDNRMSLLHPPIKGNVNVTRFDANSISVLGDINQFALSFAGDINSTNISAAASLVSAPKFQIRMIGNKKEDL